MGAGSGLPQVQTEDEFSRILYEELARENALYPEARPTAQAEPMVEKVNFDEVSPKVLSDIKARRKASKKGSPAVKAETRRGIYDYEEGGKKKRTDIYGGMVDRGYEPDRRGSVWGNRMVYGLQRALASYGEGPLPENLAMRQQQREEARRSEESRARSQDRSEARGDRSDERKARIFSNAYTRALYRKGQLDEQRQRDSHQEELKRIAGQRPKPKEELDQMELDYWKANPQEYGKHLTTGKGKAGSDGIGNKPPTPQQANAMERQLAETLMEVDQAIQQLKTAKATKPRSFLGMSWGDPGTETTYLMGGAMKTVPPEGLDSEIKDLEERRSEYSTRHGKLRRYLDTGEWNVNDGPVGFDAANDRADSMGLPLGNDMSQGEIDGMAEENGALEQQFADEYDQTSPQQPGQGPGPSMGQMPPATGQPPKIGNMGWERAQVPPDNILRGMSTQMQTFFQILRGNPLLTNDQAMDAARKASQPAVNPQRFSGGPDPMAMPSMRR